MEARHGLWRSRWAAIGAAVAVTFGAGGLAAVNAAGGVDSTAVLTDPVRVLDSRDPVIVGLNGPLASQVSQKLRVTGSIATTTGNKTVVPSPDRSTSPTTLSERADRVPTCSSTSSAIRVRPNSMPLKQPWRPRPTAPMSTPNSATATPSPNPTLGISHRATSSWDTAKPSRCTARLPRAPPLSSPMRSRSQAAMGPSR